MNNINDTTLTDTKENLKEQIVMNYLDKAKNPFALLSA